MAALNFNKDLTCWRYLSGASKLCIHGYLILVIIMISEVQCAVLVTAWKLTCDVERIIPAPMDANNLTIKKFDNSDHRSIC